MNAMICYRCANIMVKSIDSSTVCRYHQAALKYQMGQVVNSCERWLELNLEPRVSMSKQLDL